MTFFTSFSWYIQSVRTFFFLFNTLRVIINFFFLCSFVWVHPLSILISSWITYSEECPRVYVFAEISATELGFKKLSCVELQKKDNNADTCFFFFFLLLKNTYGYNKRESDMVYIYAHTGDGVTFLLNLSAFLLHSDFVRLVQSHLKE